MKKEDIETLETKIRNLTFTVVLGFIVIILLVMGLYFKNGTTKSNNSTTTSSDSSSTYDVSKMKEIKGSEAAKLFDQKGTQILYIGRSTCSVCVKLVPELNKVIANKNLTVNYLPLSSSWQTDFADLFDKLDLETTINGNKGTYGSLLKEGGYTPIVVVIKDGKMVDGFVGYRDEATITTLFEKYL